MEFKSKQVLELAQAMREQAKPMTHPYDVQPISAVTEQHTTPNPLQQALGAGIGGVSLIKALGG